MLDSEKKLLESAIDLFDSLKNSNNRVLRSLICESFERFDKSWLEKTLKGDDSMLVVVEHLLDAKNKYEECKIDYNNKIEKYMESKDNPGQVSVCTNDCEISRNKLYNTSADIHHFEAEKEKLYLEGEEE